MPELSSPGPFDAEAPSFRNRYGKEGHTPDEQDAYAVARWLADSAARGTLDRYFNPPLTLEERRIAEIEGWILGVG